MIPTNHVKESLSCSFINTVASMAGVKAEFTIKDYGVDGTFKNVIDIGGGRHLESGFPLDFQAKATVNWEVRDDFILYDLEVKTYNDMVYRHSNNYAIPLILIVFCLPKEKRMWVRLSEEKLVVKKCCYWHLIKGNKTQNKETIRISIPRKNLFEPEVLKDLLYRLERGETI